jgi:hypothetical protein
MTCYFTCVEGFTFKSVVVGSLRWSNMEGPCVQLCIMSFSQCGCQIDPSLTMVLASLWCMLCGQSSRATTMLICDQCPRCWHMPHATWDVSCQQWKKCQLANSVALSAPNRPRFLGSHSRTSLRFFSIVIHIWLGIWKIIARWLGSHLHPA